MPFQPNQLVGRYKIVARLGAGGMGEVYRAWDTRLERDVAIKVLRPGLLIEENARGRFRKEALALARLNHPNIAVVYDVGEFDGADYLVMEFVAGSSLSHKLRAGPLPAKQGLAIAAQISGALEEAHGQGVVHRDLKPSNVVLTPKGNAKVLDFGLAKLLEPASSTDAPTVSFVDPETRGPVGTLLYMSPEQAEGKPVDSRTDLWSLGVLIYETLSGKAPFRGNSSLAILQAIVQSRPVTLLEAQPTTPREASRIVSRALEKDPDKRYQSAAEMSADLKGLVAHLRDPVSLSDSVGASAEEVRVKRLWFLPAGVTAIVLVALLVAGALYLRGVVRQKWAREAGLSQIAALLDQEKPLAAFIVLKEVEKVLPADDSQLKRVALATKKISVNSTPSGAAVEIQDYLTPDGAWYRLGVTPIFNIQVPDGFFRWKVSIADQPDFVSAPTLQPNMNFGLNKIAKATPGMLPVPASSWGDFLSFVGWVGPFSLPSYEIDRFEVTNRDYQKFVDAGGYQQPKYWTEKFILSGHEIPFDEAMTQLRDATGRHGPSTWSAGHFPSGQDNYPVSGVSWYEAAAYANFVGKSLPSVAQWYNAISPDASSLIVRMSNISKDALAPVGSFPDVGQYGTYDLAGNVREWNLNTIDDKKFILGGAWDSQSYYYVEPQALVPFDRSPRNGIRLVHNIEPLPLAAAAPVKSMMRDFANVKPASDEVFQAYRSMYAYPDTPLNARVEGVVHETMDWKEERVSFETAYGHERMGAEVFLPKNIRPPYQAVVFFPSARVLALKDSSDLGDVKFFDYIVQSGRAVIYPIYKDMYERHEPLPWPWTLELMTQWYKDLSRSVEYLGTRKDIDSGKLAYVGVSMGSAVGIDLVTLMQDKFKTIVLLDGGFFLYNNLPPGVDQVDFAPRLKIPLLMVNGRYDFSFSVEKAQNPLFAMVGTPEAEKRHVIMESPHDVTDQRAQLLPEVLAWLDKYLGPVQ